MIKTAVYLLDQKLKKNHKKVILLSITLTFRRRDGGQYHLFMIFAVFNPWLLTQYINCSFYHFWNNCCWVKVILIC